MISEIDPIGLFESLAFSFLVLFLLYIVGYAFVSLICLIRRKYDPFSSMDIFQKINQRIIFGISFCFLFFVALSVLSIPFLIKSLSLLFITTGLLILGYKYRSNKTCLINLPRKFTLTSSAWAICLLAILFATMLLASYSIKGFYASTNDDGAFHTFYVRAMLDNPQVLISGSMYPYADFTNTYPPGAALLSAFILSIFNVPIHKIIIMLCAVLPVLIVLAFYSACKALFENKIISLIGAFISAFFAIDFVFGPLAWGGIALLFSFFVLTSTIGLVWTLLKTKEKDFFGGFFIGLTLFVSVQVYPPSFLFTFIWLCLILLVKIANQAYHNLNLLKTLVPLRKYFKFFAGIITPLLFSVPYFLIVYKANNPFLQNYPADIDFNSLISGQSSLVELIQRRVAFNWLLDIPSLSTFFSQFGSLLSMASCILPFIFFLYVISNLKFLSFKTGHVISSLSSIYIFFLSIMSYLTFVTSLRPSIFGLGFFDPERLWQHIFILALLCTSVIIYFLFYSVYIGFNLINNRIISISEGRKKKYLVCFLLSLLLLVNTSIIAAGSLLSEAQENYNEMGFYLNRFSSVTRDDVLLMLWIKANTPDSAVILVTAGDAGQYLTSISQRKTIYSYDLRLYSRKYQNLVTSLTSNPFSLNIIPLLQDYNISYIYIGSKALTYSQDYFRSQFNATLFSYTPFFRLVKKFGNSCLFEFDMQAANAFSSKLSSLDKAYYFDDGYPVFHVTNLLNLSEYLEENSFYGLNADELRHWMTSHIEKGTASNSTLVMIMGVAPDTVVENLSSVTLLRRYLDAGGRITWIGDVPFFYQGHKDGSFAKWDNEGPLNIINVGFSFWDFNSTPASVTVQGFEWGMAIPDNRICQRPVDKSQVTTVLSEVEGYASSWHKNFNVSFPNSGFICYSYQDYEGDAENRNRDILNLALVPYCLETMTEKPHDTS